MYLELINIDQFCKENELPEVTSHKEFKSGSYNSDGLFSQQIFGPIKSYQCACSRKGLYHGRNSDKKTCERCGIDITTSEERRKRFAKISIPYEVLNPIFYYIVCGTRPTLKTVINNLLGYRAEYYFNEDDVIKKVNRAHSLDPKYDMLQGLDGVIKIIEKMIEKNEDKEEFQFIRDNFNSITISNVLVIPPDFRPCGKNQDGVKVSDEINRLYNTLILRCNHIKDMPLTISNYDDIFKSNFSHIQFSVFEIYDYILQKMSKKEGLIRSSILGKRVDFSGRAVISPDPTLTLDYCRLPYIMILEIMKPQLTAYLVNRKLFKRYNQAAIKIDECIQSHSYELYNIVEDFVKDKVCILNRQPTLHRLSVLAFKVSVHKGNTIQIHPLVCAPYNADFDGDAMAVYFPVTDIAVKDVSDKLLVSKNLLNPSDLSLVPTPNQDIILGIWSATNAPTGELRECKGEMLPFEMALFNKCLPDNYPIQNKPCNKKRLMSILNDIVLNYSPQIVMETLDKIKSLGFTLSTMKGYTLSIKDLYNEELIDIANKLTGDRSKDLPIMSDKDTVNILKSLPFADYIDSGARGSWEQAKQLVLSRGYVSDASGKIRKELIRNSLVNGLTQEEFFNSSWGARKGLLDTATSTGDSGYLTRQLIYSTVNYELDEDCNDCGTDDYLEMEVPNGSDGEKMMKSLLWRNYLKEDGSLGRIKTSNYKSFLGKTIKLRSPIFCRNKKICKTCYGGLYKVLHSDQVGIIATQAVGERITQLVLRSFHLSGVAQAGKKGFDNQEDIISGMTIANKIFHKPQSLKSFDNNPNSLVKIIHNIFSEYGAINMVHYEIIVSSMMWSGNILWRLDENRTSGSWKWISILKVPTKTSWLLAAAFSNLRNRLLDGVIRNRMDEPSSISNLFKL